MSQVRLSISLANGLRRGKSSLSASFHLRAERLLISCPSLIHPVHRVLPRLGSARRSHWIPHYPLKLFAARPLKDRSRYPNSVFRMAKTLTFETPQRNLAHVFDGRLWHISDLQRCPLVRRYRG